MESYLNSTYLIVGGFLVITLLMGLYAGRGIKTIDEYVLGNRSFSSISLVLTFLATDIGGYCLLGYPNEVYKVGIIAFSFWIGVLIQRILMGYLFYRNFDSVNKCLTIGDLTFKFYGRNARIITGILTFFRSLLITGIQIITLGKIFNFFFDIPNYWGIIIFGTILTLYTAYGGIRSVTYTDIIQAILMFISIPLLAAILINKVGGYEGFFKNLNSISFFYTKGDYISNVSFGLLLSFGFTSITSPSVMQRVFMCGSKKKVANMLYIGAVLQFIFGICITLLGLLVLTKFPGLNQKNIIFYTLEALIPSGITKGVIISGVIAIVISSADSFLNSNSILFINDIISPIFNVDIKKTKYFKVSTFLVGLFTILFALFLNDYSAVKTLFRYKDLVPLPLLLFPVLTVIIGLKGTKKNFYISGALGVSVTLFSYFYLFENNKTLSTILGLLANSISFILMHLVEYKGFIFIKNDKKESTVNLSIEKILNFLVTSIPTPKKLLSYSKESVMKYGTNNMLFGTFVCVNFTMPYFLWRHENESIFNFLTNLRFLGGIMAGLLIVRSEWKDIIKPYFHIFWHLTLCYCLTFITTLMVLLSKGSVEWMVNVAVSIFFLILLTSGGMFLIILPTGIAAGLWVYKLKFGPINFASYGFDFNYNLFYVFFFSTIIALLFAYRKRLFYLIRGNQGMNLGGALAHELKNCGFQALPTAQLVSKYTTLKTQAIQHNGEKGFFMNEDTYNNVVRYADQTAHHMQQTIDISKGFERIFEEFKDSIANPMVISAKMVVEKAIKDFVFADEKQRNGVQLKLDNDFFAKIPKEAFSYVLTNIIRNAYKHGKATQLNIWLDNHQIHIWDNGIGISPEHLSKIFDLYYTTGDTKSTGRGLAFCKQIVDSCYGEISVDTECEGEDTYTEFTIKLPSVSSSEIDEVNLKDSENEGMSKGQEINKKKIAKEMLQGEESEDKVKKYTGLSAAEIQEIKRGLNH